MSFAWHVHHDVLIEPLTEPIEARRAYIEKTKPPGEVPTRLRLLREVRGALPQTVLAAGRAYNEARRAVAVARRAYDVARRAYDVARRAYNEALQQATPVLEILHAQECPDCPWDGQTIFPGGGVR